MQTTLEREVLSTQAEEPCLYSLKQPAPEGPTALPAHILPKGSHYQLAGSEWWIGYGQGAYEEVSHLQGIVLYNRTTHIFLKLEEATEVNLLLPELMHQGQDRLERMKQLQKKLD
jgi:hypothetical protein